MSGWSDSKGQEGHPPLLLASLVTRPPGKAKEIIAGQGKEREGMVKVDDVTKG